MRRLGAIAALTGSVLVVVQACERSPFEPHETAPVVRSTARRADLDPTVDIAMLLDSLAVGGVYTVEPTGGYSGLRYARMPERAVYANPIRGHPTGIELPVGLPVRVLAEGGTVSRPTVAFSAGYCARYGGGDSRCVTSSYTYTVHGLAPGGDVMYPYDLGTGLQVRWSRLGVRYTTPFPSPEFYGGAIPPSGSTPIAELHFERPSGCCYYPPFGDSVYTAWETYEGRWRFAVVMDDGGRPENGVPALLTLSGPRTDRPMTDSATFTLTAAGGGTLSETRWWFIQPASNTFDGEPLPFVQEPSTGLMVPRYPDAQRSEITELPECAAQSTCRYQAAHPGALVAMAKMPNGSYLGAGNRGLNRPHVRITVDSVTLAQGDTTVFRTTAPGASELRVTGYNFVPSATVTGMAMRGSRALQVPGTASGEPAVSAPNPQRRAVRQGTSTTATDGVTAVRGRRRTHFLDAVFDCSVATEEVCYDDPPQTGYEVVTAIVDGVEQRDSVLVTVTPRPPELILSCRNPSGSTDGNGGTTVVRAQTVTCSATATTGPIVVTGWSFVSADSSFLFDRDGNDPSLVTDPTTWFGVMAMSGTVSVRARLGTSSPESRSASITVTPRDWKGRAIPSFPIPRSVGQGTLPSKPRRYEDLGETDFYYDTTAHVAARNNSLAVISSGPNVQLVFVAQLPPIFSDIQILTNDAALTSGSSFWVGQVQSNSGVVFGTRPCSRYDVTSSATRNRILDHEGLTFQQGSHTQVYRDAALNAIGPAVEAVVAPDETFFDLWVNRLRPIFVALHKASKTVDDNNRVRFGCEFNFRY